eukprot:scaffold3577_cov414-Prasinococcus_capsulatus_cf.AAC.5
MLRTSPRYVSTGTAGPLPRSDPQRRSPCQASAVLPAPNPGPARGRRAPRRRAGRQPHACAAGSRGRAGPCAIRSPAPLHRPRTRPGPPARAHHHPRCRGRARPEAVNTPAAEQEYLAPPRGGRGGRGAERAARGAAHAPPSAPWPPPPLPVPPSPGRGPRASAVRGGGNSWRVQRERAERRGRRGPRARRVPIRSKIRRGWVAPPRSPTLSSPPRLHSAAGSRPGGAADGLGLGLAWGGAARGWWPWRRAPVLRKKVITVGAPAGSSPVMPLKVPNLDSLGLPYMYDTFEPCSPNPHASPLIFPRSLLYYMHTSTLSLLHR